MATVVVKSADESRSNTVTLADDSELLFAVGANETWIAHFSLYFSVATPGGAQLTFIGPTGSTGNFLDLTWNYVSVNLASSNDLGVASSIVVFLSVSVTTDVTAGNVALQWAQSTSNGTATTLAQFSSLVAIKG